MFKSSGPNTVFAEWHCLLGGWQSSSQRLQERRKEKIPGTGRGLCTSSFGTLVSLLAWIFSLQTLLKQNLPGLSPILPLSVFPQAVEITNSYSVSFHEGLNRSFLSCVLLFILVPCYPWYVGVEMILQVTNASPEKCWCAICHPHLIKRLRVIFLHWPGAITLQSVSVSFVCCGSTEYL